ncbi:MAG: serine/threonine-protein kinase [Planctomycetaceae bacterium]
MTGLPLSAILRFGETDVRQLHRAGRPVTAADYRYLGAAACDAAAKQLAACQNESNCQNIGDDDVEQSRVAETLLGDAQSLDGFERTLVPGHKSPTIGRYKLLQKIGQGGMGTVFMAEQREPVRRMVALKLIRSGMEDKGIMTRFEAERQTLALMDHQNIARVLDAGTTDDGRPYFVMELVNGVSVTKYCDERRLSIWERLLLFVQICRAIQHAHQKGIIHRDIKPSNVLVTEYDGRPVVKVIDFGLAKALNVNQRLTDETLFTAFGQVVGTLQYMSPEQAALNSLDTDTRSDVYSLGILLYELLTGETPLSRQSLKAMALEKALAAVREDEATRPSLKLSSMGDAASEISARRGSDVRRLTVSVRGDLDWIAMKSLEKDRNRRYSSAGDLADDVQRFLNGDAIEARPPSTAYRISRLVRRHKVFLGIASAFCVLLTISAIGGTWLAFRAQTAERTALAEAEHARAAEAKVKALTVQCIELLSETRSKNALQILEQHARQLGLSDAKLSQLVFTMPGAGDNDLRQITVEPDSFTAGPGVSERGSPGTRNGNEDEIETVTSQEQLWKNLLGQL